MSSLSWDQSETQLLLDGKDVVPREPKTAEFELPLAKARDIYLCHLLVVLRRIADDDPFGPSVLPFAELTVEYSKPVLGFKGAAEPSATFDCYSITPDLSELEITIEVDLPSDLDPSGLTTSVRPILHSFGHRIVASEKRQGSLGSVAALKVLAKPGSTIGDIATVAQSIRCIALGISLQAGDPVALHQAIVGIGGDILLGQVESETLEAKESYYLKSAEVKLELAIDVAAFANAERGGIIIIGARTEKDDLRRDVIMRTDGVAIEPGANLAQYQDIVSARIYPAVEGLSVRSIPASPGRHLIAILIPSQAPSSRPFIIRRPDLRTGKPITFCVPIRRGDAKDYLTVEEIHSALYRTSASLRMISQEI